MNLLKLKISNFKINVLKIFFLRIKYDLFIKIIIFLLILNKNSLNKHIKK